MFLRVRRWALHGFVASAVAAVAVAALPFLPDSAPAPGPSASVEVPAPTAPPTVSTPCPEGGSPRAPLLDSVRPSESGHWSSFSSGAPDSCPATFATSPVPAPAESSETAGPRRGRIEGLPNSAPRVLRI